MPEARRWTVEQVVAVAAGPQSVAAAEPLAVASRWAMTGADERGLWGRCRGSGAEPYDTTVDHVEVAWRCTCPSRRSPCKHALALLLLWTRGGVPEAARPAGVAAWIDARDRRAEPLPNAGALAPGGAGDSGEDRLDRNGDQDHGDGSGECSCGIRGYGRARSRTIWTAHADRRAHTAAGTDGTATTRAA